MNISDLFTEKDYEEIKKMEGRTEVETYRGPVIEYYVVDITNRPHRMKPGQMVYIVALNHALVENLANDDLYWRAEPAKFFHGLPSLPEIHEKIQKMYDYLTDNYEWTPPECPPPDPNAYPEFDS